MFGSIPHGQKLVGTGVIAKLFHDLPHNSLSWRFRLRLPNHQEASKGRLPVL